MLSKLDDDSSSHDTLEATALLPSLDSKDFPLQLYTWVRCEHSHAVQHFGSPSKIKAPGHTAVIAQCCRTQLGSLEKPL